MVAHLRLTNADPELAISPETLLTRLAKGPINLEDLTRQLNCTPDDIRETLDDSRTAHLAQLKSQLAAMQAKMRAIEALPVAMECLINLAKDSPKPEVARRSATEIFHIAGVSTTTKAVQPESLPVRSPKPRPEVHPMFSSPEEQAAVLQSMAAARSFYNRGIDLSNVQPRDHSRIVQILLSWDKKDKKDQKPEPQPWALRDPDDLDPVPTTPPASPASPTPPTTPTTPPTTSAPTPSAPPNQPLYMQAMPRPTPTDQKPPTNN